MTSITIMFINLGAVLLFMTGIWGASVIKKKASIVDGFWGLGFVLVAWLTYSLSSGYVGRKLLIAVLISIWGIRLAAEKPVRDGLSKCSWCRLSSGCGSRGAEPR